MKEERRRQGRLASAFAWHRLDEFRVIRIGFLLFSVLLATGVLSVPQTRSFARRQALLFGHFLEHSSCSSTPSRMKDGVVPSPAFLGLRTGSCWNKGGLWCSRSSQPAEPAAETATQPRKGRHRLNDEAWKAMFQKLLEYHEQHCPDKDDIFSRPLMVPSSQEDKKLFHWLCEQRKDYNNGRLPQHRQEMLEKVNFPWKSTKLDESWNKMYQHLVRMHRDGLPLVVTKAENRTLSLWIDTQRSRRRSGKLSSKRKQLLDKIDFPWSPKLEWDDMYQQLIQYDKEQREPQDFHDQDDEDDFLLMPLRKENASLALWCGRQRAAYRKGTLTPERQELLEKVRFPWTSDLSVAQRQRRKEAQTWYQMHAKLLEFQSQNQPQNAPREQNVQPRVPTKKEDPQLAAWVERQQEDFQMGTLPPARQQLLDSMGFLSLQPSSEVICEWDAKYQALRQWKESRPVNETQQQPLLGPNRTEDAALHNWAAQQRRCHREGKLDAERKALLDQLHFSWKTGTELRIERLWIKSYQKLLSCYERQMAQEGANATNFQLVVPTRDEDEALSIWITRQRMKRKLGSLTTKQMKLLNDIGFPWVANPTPKLNDNYRRIWMRYYQRLIDFRNMWYSEEYDLLDEDGITDSPLMTSISYRQQQMEIDPDEIWTIALFRFDRNLWRWLACQRRRYRIDRLSEDRVDLLLQLPGVFRAVDLAKASNEQRWLDMLHNVTHHCLHGSEISLAQEKRFENWVMRQLRYCQLKIMPPEREKVFTAWKSVLSQHFSPGEGSLSWNILYDQFVRHYKVTGEANKVSANETILYRWLVSQREQYAMGTLSEGRIERMEQIEGFSWKSGKERFQEARWQGMYKRLYKFWEENGHAQVPWREDDDNDDDDEEEDDDVDDEEEDDFVDDDDEEEDDDVDDDDDSDGDSRSLFAWVSEQRRLYRAKELPENRVQLMNDLGFEWETPSSRRLPIQDWEDT